MKRSKAKASNISPNSPELLLLAEVAGVAPSRIAGAFRDPKHLLFHITSEEFKKVLDASTRLAHQEGASPRLHALMRQMATSIGIAIADYNERKAKGQIK